MATPIGNLADLSPRAANLFAAALLVAAEDTRVSGKLVRGAGGAARLLSLNEHNVGERTPAILEAARVGPVALVSDAGTPGVSDPGARLVEAAHLAGIPVVAVPGPSALAAAVSVSGFDGSDVHFLGFLPHARGERKGRLLAAASTAATLVFFESPNRLAATLLDLTEVLADPEVVVCRELTKVHEEAVRGRASGLASSTATLNFKNSCRPPGGQFRHRADDRYVLNVAVGISAGIGALTSAVPALHPYILGLCLAVC